MKTITKITKQQKKDDRYNVYVDDQYSFSVGEDVFVQYHLRKGLPLTDDDIIEITQMDSFNRVYMMAINYLSYRMRSEKEIRTYLIQKEINLELIEQIIEKLHQANHINDREFAAAFVTDRIQHTSKGPILIKNELKEKGIHSNIIEEVIQQYSYEEQCNQAKKWLEKQLVKSSNYSFQKRNKQLKMKLRQKGFSSSIVNEVFSQISFNIDEEQEWSALNTQASKLIRRYSKKYSDIELIQKVKTGLYSRGFPSELINKYVENLNESV